MSNWIYRSRYWMAAKPTRPGVWRLRDGGWFVRGRTIDAKTGRQREVSRVIADGSAEDALAWLQLELQVVRQGRPTAGQRTRFGGFAVSLLERKIARGDIWSPKGREKWRVALEHHLVPAFGDFYLDALTRADVDAWCDVVAGRIAAGKLAASTANTHLAILRVITGAAYATTPGADPLLGVEPFKTPPGRETYSDEEPNSLLPADVPRFLAEMRASWPQHFAMVLLGISTGLRPSSLRPLRRGGATPDVLWNEGMLLVRRSQTMGEAIGRTKTGRRQRIALPERLITILRWHVSTLTERQAASELLFPSSSGGYRAGSVLEKPFCAVAEALELPYRITARAMRRTYQDLARAAGVEAIVARSVSGHTTEAMQEHYSTIAPVEQRTGLDRVLDMAGLSGVISGVSDDPEVG